MDANVIYRQMGKLAAKLRAGTATHQEETEYERLERAYDAIQARQPRGPAPRTIYDLPVARAMFEADQRQMRGAW